MYLDRSTPRSLIWHDMMTALHAVPTPCDQSPVNTASWCPTSAHTSTALNPQYSSPNTCSVRRQSSNTHITTIHTHTMENMVCRSLEPPCLPRTRQVRRSVCGSKPNSVHLITTTVTAREVASSHKLRHCILTTSIGAIACDRDHKRDTVTQPAKP